MKAYVLLEKNKYTYSDDMEEIISFLVLRGQLNISHLEVEKYYRQFSDDVYCACWMTLSDEILLEFAEWLSKQDI